MRSAGRVIALVAVMGLGVSPARVCAQSIDGAPTPAGTVSDTRWASKRLQLGLTASFITLQALDVVTTYRALSLPNSYEANPIVAGMVSRPVVMIAAKAATSAAAIYVTRRLARTRPRTAAIAMITMNAVLSAVVASNMSQGVVR
jgi:hypothetical protein